MVQPVWFILQVVSALVQPVWFVLQVTFALVELFKVEETREQVEKMYHRLFAACLVRLGSSAGVNPPKPHVSLFEDVPTVNFKCLAVSTHPNLM